MTVCSHGREKGFRECSWTIISCVPLDNKDQDSNAEFLMPKFHGKASDAVRLFCGPNVGYVWPWKSHAITDVLEVRGHKLRGQFLHPNYDHVQEDLDKNAGIQQALAVQQSLLEVRAEVGGIGCWLPAPITAADFCFTHCICP